MKVFLAADHAGFELKEQIKKFLSSSYEVVDLGAFSFDKDDDYPIFISKAAQEIEKDPNSFAIVFGKSGAGEQIVANKFKNVRAILGFSLENVRLSREHNDANILSIGSAFEDFENAKKLVKLFLETKFSGEDRHKRRIEEIKDIEDKNYA